MPGISEVLMSHYNCTPHSDWKLKEINIDRSLEWILLAASAGGREGEESIAVLYFDSDSAWWQIWGMGELPTNNLFMVFTVGGEDSCCLYSLRVDCAASAGNKTLWISSSYPHRDSRSLCNSLWQFALCRRLWLRRYLSSWLTRSHPPQHPGECRLASWCSLMDEYRHFSSWVQYLWRQVPWVAQGLALFILPSLSLPEHSDLRKSCLCILS